MSTARLHPDIRIALQLTCTIAGKRADRIELPGGTPKRAILCWFGDEALIAVQRTSAARAATEMDTLQQLRSVGAPVPKPLLQHKHWMVQEPITGHRLNIVLDAAGEDQSGAITDEAIRSLARMHEFGARAGLNRTRPATGVDPRWLEGLAAMPRRLSLPDTAPKPPIFDEIGLISGLRPQRMTFVKWDARPGNAILGSDDQLHWIDWEFCGLRDPLDDAGWLLADEFIPRLPDDLPATLGPLSARGDRASDAEVSYFLRFAILHGCVRLSLMLIRRTEQEGWNEWQVCLRDDKVGSTAFAFRRLAGHCAVWAALCPEMNPLAGWFRQLQEWCPDV